MTQLASKAIEFGEKTRNKGYYAVQGHSRSSSSVSIESPYATSYWWLILTDILSRTVSDLSQLIVQILDTAFLGDLGATYDDHLTLVGKRVGDFLLVLIELLSLGRTAEVLRAIIGSKWAIPSNGGRLTQNFT